MYSPRPNPSEPPPVWPKERTSDTVCLGCVEQLSDPVPDGSHVSDGRITASSPVLILLNDLFVGGLSSEAGSTDRHGPELPRSASCSRLLTVALVPPPIENRGFPSLVKR